MPIPLRIVLAAAAAGALASQAAAQNPARPPDGVVMAQLATADGAVVGSVTLREMRAGVLLEVDLTGLPPGPKGFHVHETGACTPDFSAAGEHLAPDGREHGFAHTETPHAGDLPNLIVTADGTAQAEFINERLTFEDLLDDDGSAIIVHSSADSYMDPASAGDRFACGVVEQVS